MIVAGLGFRRGVSAEEIWAAIALALTPHHRHCEFHTGLRPTPMDESTACSTVVEPPLQRHPRESGYPVNAGVSGCVSTAQISKAHIVLQGCGVLGPRFRGDDDGARVYPEGPAKDWGVASTRRVPPEDAHLATHPEGEVEATGFRGENAADGVCLGALATLAEKADEPGLLEAARRLSLPVIPCSRDAMMAVQNRVVTFSARAQAAVGLPSVAEAAALAASGGASRLLVPRVATAAATCAIAEGDAP